MFSIFAFPVPAIFGDGRFLSGAISHQIPGELRPRSGWCRTLWRSQWRPPGHGIRKGLTFHSVGNFRKSQLMNSFIFFRGVGLNHIIPTTSIQGFNGLNREIFGFHLPVSSFFLVVTELGKFADYFSGARGANFHGQVLSIWGWSQY